MHQNHHDLLVGPGGSGIAAAWALAPRFELVQAVQDHLRRALEHRQNAQITCCDNWSARIAIDAVADRPDRDTLHLAVPRASDESARELAVRAARHGVALTLSQRMTQAHAGGIVVAQPHAPGAGATEPYSPVRCTEGVTFVWSQSLLWPRHASRTRTFFGSDGFVGVSVDVVGVHRGIPGWIVGSSTTVTGGHIWGES